MLGMYKNKKQVRADKQVQEKKIWISKSWQTSLSEMKNICGVSHSIDMSEKNNG